MPNGVEYKPFANLPVQLPQNNGYNTAFVQNRDVSQGTCDATAIDNSAKKTSKFKLALAAIGITSAAFAIAWGMPALRHHFFDKNKQSKAIAEKTFKGLLQNEKFIIFREKFETISDTIESKVTNPVKKFLRRNLFNYINPPDNK